MPEPTSETVEFPRDGFARELEVLSAEAQQHIEERAIRKVLPSLIKALRPLVLGIEALSRATEENTTVLYKLQTSTTAQLGLSDLMTNVQEKIDQKQTINQQLFDALHSELKDYKDGFLLEVLQKPIIRDLIELYDELSAVASQLKRFLDDDGTLSEAAPEKAGHLRTIHTNMHHTIGALVEVFERMEVALLPTSTGKLDKQTQRAVSVVPAESSAEDLEIVESLRPGFTWKERLFRPEEVVIKKWKDGYLMAMPPRKEPAAASGQRT